MAYTYAELREDDVVSSWNDSSLNKNVSEIAEKLQISSKGYKASVFGRNGQSTTPFWHRFKTKKDTAKTDIEFKSGSDSITMSIKEDKSCLMGGARDETLATLFSAVKECPELQETNEFKNLLNTIDGFDSVVVEGNVNENLKLGNSEICYLDDVHKRFMDDINDMFKKYPKFGHAFIIEAITGWNKFGFGNKASANYVGILSKQSDYVSVYDMNCPSDRNYLTDLNKIRLQARFKSASIKESGSKTGQYRCWSVFSLITKY